MLGISGTTVAQRATALLVLLCLHSSSAAAEDIPVISLTRAGPNRNIPVGKQFYLEGEAGEEVTRVQPLLIRKGSRSMFVGEGPACSDLVKSFGNFKPAAADGVAASPASHEEKATPVTNIPDLKPGLHGGEGIWEKGSGKVLVPPAWAREKKTGKQSWKLLVPGEPEFFIDGFEYCLLLYERVQAKKTDNETVRALLMQYAAQVVDTCSTKKTPEERDSCADAMTVDYETKLAQFLGKLTDAEAKRLSSKAREAVGFAFDQSYAQQTAKAVLKSWRHPYTPNPEETSDAGTEGFLRPVTLPMFWEIQSSMGRALAILLARQGALLPNPQSIQTVYYGPLEVRRLGVLDDLNHIRVAGESKDKQPTLETETNELPLPRSSVTLHDVLALSRGQLRFGKQVLNIEEVSRRLKPLLDDPRRVSDEQLEEVSRLSNHLQELGTVLQRAFSASKGFDCSKRKYPAEPALLEGTTTAAEAHLGEWLRCDVVKTCEDKQLAVWKAKASCGSEARAWPGYASPGVHPIFLLATALRDIVDARKQLEDLQGELASTAFLEETREATRPFDVRVAFSQETWVFSYVTPVLGYTVMPVPDDSFTLFYVGAQIHFVPNHWNDPLWTHGCADIARAVALEVGFAPRVSSFGPSNRFQGWKGLPPFFVGVAAHVIPYTSFSTGVTFLERRTTTLSGEKYRSYVTPYLGLNAQFNIPDLIKAAAGRGTETKAEK